MFEVITTPTSLRERVLEYVGAHTTMNLATVGPAGLWCAAVLYVNDGLDFYFTSVATTQHGRNMLATRRVAATINEDCRTFLDMKGIQLEGALHDVADVDLRTRIVAAYLRKFPFACGLWNGVSDPLVIGRDPGVHGFYRVVPSRLYFSDNEYRPGVREELAIG